MIVGVLSDTHSHLYSEVKKALEGGDHIIHAGDVGSPKSWPNCGRSHP